MIDTHVLKVAAGGATSPLDRLESPAPPLEARAPQGHYTVLLEAA